MRVSCAQTPAFPFLSSFRDNPHFTPHSFFLGLTSQLPAPLTPFSGPYFRTFFRCLPNILFFGSSPRAPFLSPSPSFFFVWPPPCSYVPYLLSCLLFRFVPPLFHFPAFNPVPLNSCKSALSPPCTHSRKTASFTSVYFFWSQNSITTVPCELELFSDFPLLYELPQLFLWLVSLLSPRYFPLFSPPLTCAIRGPIVRLFTRHPKHTPNFLEPFDHPPFFFFSPPVGTLSPI